MVNIKLQPRYTQEDNSCYDFIAEAEEKKPYKIKIVIDELNDSLLLNYSLDLSEFTCCTCGDYMFRHRHCKHITACKDLLKGMNINFREVVDEPVTKE